MDRSGSSQVFIEDDPSTSTLRQIGLDPTDAHHVMLVVRARRPPRAGCDVFLTCDTDFLDRRAAIEAAFLIRVMKPTEFVS